MTEQKNWEFVDLHLPEMPGLCLVISRMHDGSFLPKIVSQHPGAVAYAAAWRDHAGRIIENFDLWVQDLSSWHLDTESTPTSLTNPALDRLWQQWHKSMAVTHPAKVIDFGLDQHPTPVIWLNADAASVHSSNTEWKLCINDSLLKQNRLATYSNTLHRYLWNQNQDHPVFLALTPGAPEGPSTRPLPEIFGKCLPINPGGSLMALFRSDSFPLNDFVDVLGNRKSLQELRECSRNPIRESSSGLPESGSSTSKNTGFFFQRNQMVGHLCELLHLKLAVFHGVLLATSEAVRHAGCPMLGLHPVGFGVALPELNTSLPFLWSHKITLESPPQCTSVHLGDVGEPCFIPDPGLGQSIYRSPGASTDLKGFARIRIRKISEPDDYGLVIMDGTLISEEPLHAGRLDLLEMEWVLPRLGRLRCYARIEGKSSDNIGEYRFVTLQSKLQSELQAWLNSGKGSLTSDRVSFRLLPRIGTPCDLYSLGVIGLRILLHHPEGVAGSVDDLLSLARAFRMRYSNANWSTGNASLYEFAKTGEAGPIVERLGPQWLMANDSNADDAFREIPASLWWSIIDFISRFFPGESLDSFCKSNDDFHPRAPQEVFNAPIATLETLLLRTRELLFGTPSVNREILIAIRSSKK